MVARALSSSVDFPTPGSPPSRTSEPGTSPPPSTRSSSGTPVAIRSASCASTSTRRRSLGASAGRGPPSRSSTSVPNAPQPGQRPSQRPAAVPHSAHTNWTAAGLATPAGYGRHTTDSCRLGTGFPTTAPSAAAEGLLGGLGRDRFVALARGSADRRRLGRRRRRHDRDIDLLLVPARDDDRRA